MQQSIRIPMGANPDPFWANLFLYSKEEECNFYRQIQSYTFPFNWFIDDFLINKWCWWIWKIFLRYISNRAWASGWKLGQSASFLHLNTTMKYGTFMNRLFNKRNISLFSIVQMSHMNNQTPQNIFYFTIKGKFLRTAL